MFGSKLTRIDRLAAQKKTHALIALTNDRDEAVRLAAIRALGSCGDDSAYGMLIALVRASEAAVRKSAILALADMNRPAGRIYIEQQLRVEKDSQVLTVIENALRRFTD